MMEGTFGIEGGAVAFGLHRPFGEGVIGFFPQVERFLVTFPATRRAAVLRKDSPLVLQQGRSGWRGAGGAGAFPWPAPGQPPARKKNDDDRSSQHQPPCSAPKMKPASARGRLGLRASFARFGHAARMLRGRLPGEKRIMRGRSSRCVSGLSPFDIRTAGAIQRAAAGTAPVRHGQDSGLDAFFRPSSLSS